MSDYNPWAEPQPSQPTSDSSETIMQPAAGQPARPADGASAYPQPSAASQSSAPFPQASASSQPSAAYPPQQQASAAYPSQPAAPVTSEQPGGQYALVQPNPTGGNNFAALFDFGFKKFATRSIVKIFYALNFLVALGVWLLPAVLWLLVAGYVAEEGSQKDGQPFVVAAVLQFMFGWIQSLILLMLVRMICEFFVHQQQSAESLLKLETRLP